MKWSSFRYLVRQGWHSMVANRLMTVASVGVLTACLFITGVAALVNVNVNSFVDYLSAQNEIEVYLNDDVTADAAAALQEQLEALDNVSACTYTSKAQAVEDMKGWFGADADLLDSYAGEDNADNPLPASLVVTVTDLSQLTDTVQQISTICGASAYKIKAPGDLATVLVGLKRIVTYVGWGLVGVLGIVSIVVISNTIRLTVFARRKEINIMKFVGATNAFIRLPFFVEGMTVGAIAGVLATGIVCGAYYAALRYASQPGAAWLSEFTRCLVPLGDVWMYVLGGFVLFGVFIGSVGCSVSIRRHLKV